MKSKFHFRHGHTFISSPAAQPALVVTQRRGRCLPAFLSPTAKLPRYTVNYSPFCTEIECVGAVPPHHHTVLQTADFSRQVCDVLSRDHTYDSVLTALTAPLLCTAVYDSKLKYCIIRNLCGQTPERHVRVALYRGSFPHAH